MLPIQPESNMANAMAPQADSRMYVREHRITKGGRHLWYQLEVLQQPERARACGSGPKSSADRRPVDPPPVVTLRVFEGEHFDGARDITFDYNVDFFCYASLEHARPMAHGRVQTPAATSPPVLTGFPVSGCCYLDRPDPAGYFLFPDLSVRHEGRYRLVFSLYELIKEEQDQDRDAPHQDHEDGMSDLMNAGNANHRMDLRSTDFIVYSAKKFPGLTESTSLSRTVAEQGCRVRIRRDVRMRRRDTKANAASEYDNNAEDEYARRRNRTQTPETYRARSMSNSSMDRVSYVPDQRRPSNAEYGPPPPPLYQNGGPQPSTMLNFGHGGNAGFAQPYGPAPTSGQSTPVSPAAPMFPQSNNFPPPPPSPSYAPPGYPHYESASDQEMRRRSSASYSTISNNPPAPYSLPRAPPRPPTASSMGPIPSLSSLIPIQSPKMSPSHYSDRSCSISALSRPTYPQPEPRSMKRSIDELTSSTQQGRNVNGDRPSIDYPGVPFYRRADGSERTANFPDPL